TRQRRGQRQARDPSVHRTDRTISGSNSGRRQPQHFADGEGRAATRNAPGVSKGETKWRGAERRNSYRSSEPQDGELRNRSSKVCVRERPPFPRRPGRRRLAYGQSWESQRKNKTGRKRCEKNEQGSR